MEASEVKKDKWEVKYGSSCRQVLAGKLGKQQTGELKNTERQGIWTAKRKRLILPQVGWGEKDSKTEFSTAFKTRKASHFQPLHCSHSGRKGPWEVSSPSPCPSQGQLWHQTRLLRAFSRHVLEWSLHSSAGQWLRCLRILKGTLPSTLDFYLSVQWPSYIIKHTGSTGRKLKENHDMTSHMIKIFIFLFLRQESLRYNLFLHKQEQKIKHLS